MYSIVFSNCNESNVSNRLQRQRHQDPQISQLHLMVIDVIRYAQLLLRRISESSHVSNILFFQMMYLLE